MWQQVPWPSIFCRGVGGGQFRDLGRSGVDSKGRSESHATTIEDCRESGIAVEPPMIWCVEPLSVDRLVLGLNAVPIQPRKFDS
jgi:hypothetical protein